MLKKTFLEGMSRVAATVSVVTTDGEAGRYGATVSAMTSVSVDPGAPSLLVCLHSNAQTAKAICRNNIFCVNVLQSEQGRMADLFAGRLKNDTSDKFSGGNWKELATGAPVFVDALVSFDCNLTETIRCGSHWIFIGEVVEMSMSAHQAPLVYTNRAYRKLTVESDNHGHRDGAAAV